MTLGIALASCHSNHQASSFYDVADGHLYYQDYSGDYQLDEALQSEVGSTPDLMNFIFTHLIQGAPSDNAQIGTGCSAFMVHSPEGDILCGRNFDYRFLSSANIMLHTTSNASHASLGIAAMPFLDKDKFVAGAFGDSANLKVLPATPYLCMDGVNDAGLFIAVLSLKNGGAVQHDSAKTAINPSVGIRMVLDHCATVNDAITAFQQHNFMADGEDSPYNYHFLLADAEGQHCVMEFTRPEGATDWVMNIIDADHVTNFYLSDGWQHIGVGQDRYATLHNRLDSLNRVMTEDQCMQLLNDVHTILHSSEITSNTQWSVVYNLTKRTAMVCVNKDYKHPYRFSL